MGWYKLALCPTLDGALSCFFGRSSASVHRPFFMRAATRRACTATGAPTMTPPPLPPRRLAASQELAISACSIIALRLALRLPH